MSACYRPRPSTQQHAHLPSRLCPETKLTCTPAGPARPFCFSLTLALSALPSTSNRTTVYAQLVGDPPHPAHDLRRNWLHRHRRGRLHSGRQRRRVVREPDNFHHPSRVS
ncbi:hypothetical protein FIBSPDRAFT_873132 [Athelia psychrophila]|uniref:Uncharacterized protein n=1 Tax=Athelia psychrophila TaxID=1759441 RepID=A0A165YTB5_9AGAM|nr:hypothetical protein FIBSPDRAFT_873132 [Fibularhizoctonia sp. CBS 109695]